MIGHQLIVGLPAELLGQDSYERALADADIAGDRDVLAAGRSGRFHAGALLSSVSPRLGRFGVNIGSIIPHLHT
jgi:hypothetical protein